MFPNIQSLLLKPYQNPEIIGTYEDFWSTTANASSYTHTFDIGTAPTGGKRRWIVMMAGERGGASMWWVEKPTGTTASLTYNIGSTSTGIMISIYSLVRAGSDLVVSTPATFGSAWSPVSATLGGSAMTKIAANTNNYAPSTWSGTVVDGISNGVCLSNVTSWNTSNVTWGSGFTELRDGAGGDGMHLSVADKKITTNGDQTWSGSGLVGNFDASGGIAANFR